MAPKSSEVRSLHRSLQALTQQVATLSKGAAKVQGSSWACSECDEGANNYAHRTTCFKCGAMKPTGPRRPGAQTTGSGRTRTKSRQRAAATPADAGRKAMVTEQDHETADNPPKGESATGSADQDPVAVELSIAKSQHLWALRLKDPAKAVELPKAEKRLAEAQAANQERRPPAERLRAALSRVEAKQKRLDEAKTVSKQAQAALDTAQGDEEQAEEQLQEAQQELAQAQAMHVEATRSASAGSAGSPAAAPDGRTYLDAVLRSLQPGSEQSELLLKFLESTKNGLPPPYPNAAPGNGLTTELPTGNRGPPTPTPRPPGRRSSDRTVRSRSRSREADPAENADADASVGNGAAHRAGGA